MVVAFRGMRAIFDDAGGGGWSQPAGPIRRRFRRACWAVILVMSFGWGAVIAATYDGIVDQQARGVMDRPW